MNLRSPGRRIALVVVALAVVMAACGGSATPEAATVADDRIERSQLDDELRILMENDLFRTQALGIPEFTSTLDVGLTASWLQNLIAQVVVDAEVEARGLETTDEDLLNARATLEAGFGPDAFAAFPESFQEDLVARTARFDVLARDLVGEPPTEDELEAFFEENRDLYVQSLCPTDALVAHVLVETEDEAQAVVDELSFGADFATIAQERSLDTGSAASGGQLGCLQVGVFVPEFEAAALAAAPGEPTAPVETDFGFHVIVVTGPAITFEAVRDQVQADVVGEGGAALGLFLEEQYEELGVDVDPRYGTWVAGDGVATASQVVPPEVPVPRDGREPVPELPVPLPEG